MATRKNLKKTGKPKRRGAKKRKTVRKGGMWPFGLCMGSGCVSVPETVESGDKKPTLKDYLELDITTPEQMFEITEVKKQIYKKIGKLEEGDQKDELEHYYLRLGKNATTFFDENKKALIVYMSNLSEADFKKSMTQLDYNFRMSDEYKTQMNNAHKKTQMNINNLNVNQAFDILKSQGKTSQNAVLNNPDLVDIISSFGPHLILTPKMLFGFLIKINPESLSETERSQLEAFKKYYNKNKSVVNDAIEEYYIKRKKTLNDEIGKFDAKIEQLMEDARVYARRGISQKYTEEIAEEVTKETEIMVKEKEKLEAEEKVLKERLIRFGFVQPELEPNP